LAAVPHVGRITNEGPAEDSSHLLPLLVASGGAKRGTGETDGYDLAPEMAENGRGPREREIPPWTVFFGDDPAGNEQAELTLPIRVKLGKADLWAGHVVICIEANTSAVTILDAKPAYRTDRLGFVSKSEFRWFLIIEHITPEDVPTERGSMEPDQSEQDVVYLGSVTIRVDSLTECASATEADWFYPRVMYVSGGSSSVCVDLSLLQPESSYYGGRVQPRLKCR